MKLSQPPASDGHAVRNYERMRSPPLDLAEGIRKALRKPGPVAIRSLLAATLGPEEGGAVFLADGSKLGLVGALPREAPFRAPAVLALARRASVARSHGVIVPDAPVSAAWPAALLVALPERRGALVLLGRASISAETRSRAPLLASMLALVADLERARAGPRQVDAGQLVDAILGLGAPDRTLGRLCRDLVSLAAALTGAHVGALWVREEGGTDFELQAAHRGEGKAEPRRILRHSRGEWLGQEHAQRRRPDPASRGRDLLRAPDLRSVLLAPFQLDDEPIGVLAVGRVGRAGSFNADSAGVLTRLTALATVPLAQAARTREIADLRRGLRAARRIGRAVTEGRSLDELFRLATRELQRIATFDRAGLLVVESSREATLTTIGRAGREPRVFPVLPQEAARLGAALRRRQALTVRKAITPGSPLAPLLRSDPDVRAAVAVPLTGDHEAVGALILASRTPEQYQWRHVGRLRPIARALALAVVQAQGRSQTDAVLPAAVRPEPGGARGAARYAAIGRLTGALAHEIRNPLTVIGTTIQYLRNRRLVADEYLPLLDAAVHKAREVDESLESLLSLSRPIELRREPASIASLLGEVAEFIRVRAGEHAVDVTVDADRELRAMVDRRFLGQALLNLALNAIEAMRGGGHLAFGACRAPSGQVLLITVSDTGSGIEKDNLDTVFDPYFTTKLHGTGLGLAITRRIIEEHGGSIEVASERGRGTTFTVTLAEAS
jgi:signal transduction histidine kinase